MTMPSKSIGINNISNDNKKASKPLIEKRRRARINSSLAELKEIVVTPPSTTASTTTRPPKLEKADILEMTVAYLRNMLNKPDNRQSTYSSGYELCADEVFRFLEQEGFTSLKTRLKTHLRSLQPTTNIEIKNASNDDSMSCSSRSQTPSTSGTDISPMEYSSCSPFTDSEHEAPSASCSTLTNERIFPTNETYYRPNNFVEYQSPVRSASNSYQDTVVVSGPLDLATSSKRVMGGVAATSQVLQSAVNNSQVNNRTQHVYSQPVPAYNCNQFAQDPNSSNSNPSSEGMGLPCSSNEPWRPW